MNLTPPKIVYAGYGLLKDKGFTETLLGRPLSEPERLRRLSGMELRIVQKNEIESPLVQNDPEVPEDFRIYGLVDTKNDEDFVTIRLLELNQEEYSLIRVLNFGDEIFDSKTQETLEYKYVIDLLKNPNVGQRTEGLNYNPFLNGLEYSGLVWAVREEAQRQTEGRSSSKERV